MADMGATDPNQAIAEARAQIDEIDLAILDLMGQRVKCNVAIAAAKAASGVKMPLRPAREVQMLRRLTEHAPEGVDRALIVDVWRTLIAANVARQQPIDVAVAGGGDQLHAFDIARRHFGGASKIVKTVDARDALTRALETPATVALMPWPGTQGLAAWWPILAESRFHGLAIIAALPMGSPAPEACIVAANATLEPAGGDRTFALAFDPHFKFNRSMNEAHLSGREVARVRETVLIEFDDFVGPDDPRIGLMRVGLAGVRVIGSYALI